MLTLDPQAVSAEFPFVDYWSLHPLSIPPRLEICIIDPHRLVPCSRTPNNSSNLFANFGGTIHCWILCMSAGKYVIVSTAALDYWMRYQTLEFLFHPINDPLDLRRVPFRSCPGLRSLWPFSCCCSALLLGERAFVMCCKLCIIGRSSSHQFKLRLHQLSMVDHPFENTPKLCVKWRPLMLPTTAGVF